MSTDSGLILVTAIVITKRDHAIVLKMDRPDEILGSLHWTDDEIRERDMSEVNRLRNWPSRPRELCYQRQLDASDYHRSSLGVQP